MKTINATLSTNQKVPYGLPLATATLADNGRLHLARYLTHTIIGKLTAGTRATNTFNRIRTSTSGVFVQRITDPTVSSQWTTWTLITATVAKSDVAPAIFYTGTFVVIVWQDDATGDIKYARSGNEGVSWGPTATAYAALATAELSGVSFDDTTSGMVMTYGSQLYWASYNATLNTWAAVVSAAITMLSANPSCAAFLDGPANRLVVVYVPEEVTDLYRLKLMTYDLGGGGWAAVRAFFESRNSAGSGGRVSLSQVKINGYRWLEFKRIKQWGGPRHYLAASDDGLFYQDFLALDADVANDFHVLGDLPASPGVVYAANEATVLRSLAQTFWSAATVRNYKFSAELSQPGEIVVDVDNRTGLLAEPKLFSKLTLDRGLRIDGTDYTVGAGSFFVTRFLYIIQDNLIRIEATDALGLLAAWSADQTFLFSGERVDKLVELVCGLAGVHVVAFDAAAVWADTLALFAIHANSTALSALRELQARASFEVVAKGDGSLSCFVPAAAPASGYTYGSASGQHAHWPGLFGRGGSGTVPPPTALFVAGDFDPAIPKQYGGEAHDLAAQAAQALRLSDLLRDDRLISDAQASALASSRLILAQEAARVGSLDAPPSFSLEPGDVVDFTTGFALAASPWRVHAFTESYNQPGKNKFFQRLTLRGTA